MGPSRVEGSAGRNRSVLGAHALQRTIAFCVRHRIQAENIDVVRELAAQLFQLNRLRRSAFGPQASCAFPAKRHAGTCVPGSGGGLTHTVDGIKKSARVRCFASLE